MIFNLTQPVLDSAPKFTYTGAYEHIDDGGGNWRIRFLTSGILTTLKDMLVDAFLVGAGGGGAYAGAGGGYTVTSVKITLKANTEYSIEIGTGGAPGSATPFSSGSDGGNTTAFNITAYGGKGSSGTTGGDGGSGGGSRGASGGSDGSNGESYGGNIAGKGQGTTTREFGESSGTLYSSGGGGFSGIATAGEDNTGDGGGTTKKGGSGIVIIRKHKEAAA